MDKNKKMYNRIMTPEDILKLSDSFGLNLDTQGGVLIGGADTMCVEKPEIGSYSLQVNSESPILFFNPSFFQKTVEMTEDSIKIKLFH